MATETREGLRLRAQLAANTGWANTPDRLARTAPGRRAAEERFERLVDPECVLPAVTRLSWLRRLLWPTADQVSFVLSPRRWSLAVPWARNVRPRPRILSGSP
jgi:hypothetical protein